MVLVVGEVGGWARVTRRPLCAPPGARCRRPPAASPAGRARRVGHERQPARALLVGDHRRAGRSRRHGRRRARAAPGRPRRVPASPGGRQRPRRQRQPAAVMPGTATARPASLCADEQPVARGRRSRLRAPLRVRRSEHRGRPRPRRNAGRRHPQLASPGRGAAGRPARAVRAAADRCRQHPCPLGPLLRQPRAAAVHDLGTPALRGR